MRDSISLLELCASGGKKIDVYVVNETIGSAGRERMMAVANAIAEKNYEFLFKEIDEVVTSSKDITVFWQDLISLYRDLLVVKTVRDSAKYLDLTDFELRCLVKLSGKFTREALMYHCRMLEDALSDMQSSGAVKRIVAELCFVKMCDESLSTSTEALLLRISNLETKLASGDFVQPRTDGPVQEEKTEKPKKKEKSEINEESKQEPKKEIVFADEPKKEVKLVTPSPDAKSIKPLKVWSDAVQSIELNLGIPVYSVLKKLRAYLGDDNKIHVLLNDNFSILVIDKPIVKSTLASSLSKYLEKRYSENDIIFEQDSGKVKLEDDLSDLDAFDEF